MTASADSGLPLDDVFDLSTALDLVDAKIELLSEYKLKYPQDYTPGGPVHERRGRAAAPAAHAPDGPAGPPGSRVLRPEKTTMP
ncbi:hypothetical protein KMT30_08530 [Streptomyces sp. IBSBF 2953]|nr:hypothetical protein [Streptomyces hayashii]